MSLYIDDFMAYCASDGKIFAMPAEKKYAEFRTFLRETLVYHAVDFMWILIFMLYPPP